MPSDSEIRRICEDPAVSYWLRDALLGALKRDPIDAAADAGLLSLVLDKRASEILSKATADISINDCTKNK